MIKTTLLAGCIIGAFIGLSPNPPVDTHRPLQPVQVPPVYDLYPQQESTPTQYQLPSNSPYKIKPTSTACAPGIINCGVLHT